MNRTEAMSLKNRKYPMPLKEIRNQKNWSQDELAQLSGLSLRTIQRIEQSHTAGLDSLKSLAAALDVDVADLQKELSKPKGNTDTDLEKIGADKNRILRFYILSGGMVFSLIFPLVSALQDPSNWGPFIVMSIAWAFMITMLALMTFDFFEAFSKNK